MLSSACFLFSVPVFQPFHPIYYSSAGVATCATCMQTPGGSTMKEDSPCAKANTAINLFKAEPDTVTPVTSFTQEI